MLVESKMLSLGSAAPDFSLIDVNQDKIVSLQTVRSDIATVVMFICNHCPYVIHIHDQLIQVAQRYQQRGITFIAINANDVDKYPADAPDKMREQAYPFPYLFDADQSVAKAYDAACTPDIYVFDAQLQCVYRGQFDDSRPNSGTAADGASLRAALDAILAGDKPSLDQKPSIGCNIKWKM